MTAALPLQEDNGPVDRFSRMIVQPDPNHFIVVDHFVVVGSRPPNKALVFTKSLKKESLAWKLLMLSVIALCGLSLYFIHTGQRNLFFVHPIQKQLFLNSTFQVGKAVTSFQCPTKRRNLSEDFKQHYPRPHQYDRGKCTCTPVHYFVILSMQRSGSGWFETLLNNHPNISSHGEVFAGRENHNNFSIILKKLNEVYSLDYASSAMKEECTSAVGFKWMLNQGLMEYNKEIASYFQQNGVSIIFLMRRNLLRRLVSVLANAYDRETKQLNGTHKSHVHSKEEAYTLATFKPTINQEFLSSNLHHVMEITEGALQLFNSTRHTIMYYEDLVKNKRRLVEIQQFLGVPPIKLESQQVKIHTRPLSDQIENWDVVSKALQGTEFEGFLAQKDYV